MLLLGDEPFLTLSDTTFSGTPTAAFSLVDWDGDGTPEVAAVTDFSGITTQLEVRALGGAPLLVIPLTSPDAKIDVLRGTPDRLCLVDEDSVPGNWFLQVLGLGGVEAPVSFLGPVAGLAVGYHDEDTLPDVAVSVSINGSRKVYLHRQGGPSYSSSDVVFASGEVYGLSFLADLDGDGDGELATIGVGNNLVIDTATPVDAGLYQFTPDKHLVDDPIAEPEAEYDFSLPNPLPADVTHIRLWLWSMTGQFGEVLPGTEQLLEVPLGGSSGGEPFTLPVAIEHALPYETAWYLTELRLIARTPETTQHAYPPVLGLSDITFGDPPPQLSLPRLAPIPGSSIPFAGTAPSPGDGSGA